MKLHVSIVMLSSPSLVRNQENVNYAGRLINDFIFKFQSIYGKGNVTFNVHALSHLAKDVLKYGPLDSYSAYPFESYLCAIKKLAKSRYKKSPEDCQNTKR